MPLELPPPVGSEAARINQMARDPRMTMTRRCSLPRTQGFRFRR